MTISFTILNYKGQEYWWRVVGGRYGRTLYIQKPCTPQQPRPNRLLKCPILEKPTESEIKEILDELGEHLEMERGK